MKTKIYKNLIRATILLSLTVFSSIILAQPAILMGSTICDNQENSFTYQWKNSNLISQGNKPYLFFINGNNAANGRIYPVGHGNNFNLSPDVYITIHGNANQVADFNGNDFATVFHNNHLNTPIAVTMYVCQSGTPAGPAHISSMAYIARRYPGVVVNSTLIETMTAPANGQNGALRGPTQTGGLPIQSLNQATYRGNPQQQQPQYNTLLQQLLNSWAGTDGTRYPGSAVSFGDFCQQQLANDPTGQWIPNFIQNVVQTFQVQYLQLINLNSAGTPLATCGVANGIQCN